METTTMPTVEEMEWRFGKRLPIVRESPAPVRLVVAVPTAPALEEDQCCSAAERAWCVCRVKWSCAVHGDRCVGSHD
jgi:hypothetical protein